MVSNKGYLLGILFLCAHPYHLYLKYRKYPIWARVVGIYVINTITCYLFHFERFTVFTVLKQSPKYQVINQFWKGLLGAPYYAPLSHKLLIINKLHIKGFYMCKSLIIKQEFLKKVP
jgi:hypothetical protein